MFIGLKFILARAFKVEIFGFHSMRSPSHVTTLSSWAEVAITFLAEEKSNASITKREWYNVLILPTLNDPLRSRILKMYSGIHVHNRICCTIVLFYLSSNKIIDKSLCQCELLCAVPSCILAPKCCLQPKKFSTPLSSTVLFDIQQSLWFKKRWG